MVALETHGGLSEPPQELSPSSSLLEMWTVSSSQQKVLEEPGSLKSGTANPANCKRVEWFKIPGNHIFQLCTPWYL